jgi:16S rRNA (cytosine1402-N4)-methyltransferase
MEFEHIPVLYKETQAFMKVKPGDICSDFTLGRGGLAPGLIEALKGEGRLIAFDIDPDAIAASKERLAPFQECLTIIQSNYCEAGRHISALGYAGKVASIILDAGVSSFQLDEPARGFSYQTESRLDMRLGKKGATAEEIVNTLEQKELERIIREYGEERFAYYISRAIVKAREVRRIETTLQLAEIIKKAYPPVYRWEGKHPARKTFQALRIFLNNELENLALGLDAAFEMLKAGGRLCVISFHSLEDRTVKNKIKEWITGCVCDKGSPICTCGREPEARLVTRKPIMATEEELEANPRSRSAKLRCCEKL